MLLCTTAYPLHIRFTNIVLRRRRDQTLPQGVLSQTFKFVATYDGEPNAGVPTEFIAKFLNPDPAFSFFRMVCGSQGMTAFQQEDWCYANEFYKKAGVRSVFCFVGE